MILEAVRRRIEESTLWKTQLVVMRGCFHIIQRKTQKLQNDEQIIINVEDSEQELNLWIIDVLKLIEDLNLQIKMTHPISDEVNERKLIA